MTATGASVTPERAAPAGAHHDRVRGPGRGRALGGGAGTVLHAPAGGALVHRLLPVPDVPARAIPG
jgi:hypothetical protein